MPCSGSIDMLAQTFAVPVFFAISGGSDVESPFQLAGLGVDGKYGAGRSFRLGPVLARPTDEQRILVDGRRLQNRERPFVVGRVPSD